MDRFDHFQLLQHRKKRSSKSYGGEGDGRIEKRINASGRQLNSSFSVGLSTEDNLLDFDFRRSSSNQTIGAPIKMLLAEEMSKELESRRRSPSVIARLMGLDPLPTQQPIDKQQKKFSESFLQGKKSTGFQEKYVSYKNGSLWKSGKEQPEFKDVFEVVDASMVEKRNIRMARNGMSSSRPSEPKMALIRQKFMDAKRLSTHENLWQSKEFHDALEVLDSNKDLFQKFLREPDSFLAKHLHDMQPVPSAPQPNRVTGLKSSKFTKYETRDLCQQSDKRMERHMQMRNDNGKHECGCVSHNIDDVYLSQKSTRLEGKTGACLLPTRIVVLKPSLGREQSAARAVSSSSSSTSSRSSNRRYRDFWRSGNQELFPEIRDRPKLVNDVDLLRYRTKTSREIAREITQQMRQSLSSGSPNLSYLGQGYAGDESSYCTSGKDSVTDNKASTQTSKHYYERSKRYVPSSSYATESSVSREARKRLSERWKMTNRLQAVGPVGRGSSTLGEMLAMSDREGAVAVSASRIDMVGSGKSSSGVDALEICEYPSGISSRDGWKDAFPRHLPRSKSLPASSTIYGSEKTSRCDAACNDNQCMLKEVVNQGPNNYVKENSDQKGSSCPEHIKLSGRNSRSYLHEDEEIMDTIREIYVSPDETKNIFESRDLCEQLIVAEPSTGCIVDTMLLTDDVMVPECEEKMDSKTHEEPLPEPTTCKMLVTDGEFADGYQNDLIIEKTSLDQPQEETHSQATELESPHSSKGAEQPSPVSVLEPPFEVETSGSECFQKVSADLHGLRMQLQLLKLETVEAYTEGADFIVSSDEEPGEGCDSVMQDRREHSALLRDLESRDFSFLLDVLVDSGFHDVAYPEILFATWHSPELPIGPGVFEMLEKKYGGQFMWQRSERRLLFDCINLALAEILKQDQYPWIKLKGRRVATMLADSGALADKVWELVVQHGKEGCGDTPEKVLGRNFLWLELGDDIKVIGTEMERLLMDELMEELLCGLSSGRVL